MGDLDRSRVNLAFDNTAPAASKDLAIALIDKGNALEAQGLGAEGFTR
jgi:hypothetical protein